MCFHTTLFFHISKKLSFLSQMEQRETHEASKVRCPRVDWHIPGHLSGGVDRVRNHLEVNMSRGLRVLGTTKSLAVPGWALVLPHLGKPTAPLPLTPQDWLPGACPLDGPSWGLPACAPLTPIPPVQLDRAVCSSVFRNTPLSPTK